VKRRLSQLLALVFRSVTAEAAISAQRYEYHYIYRAHGGMFQGFTLCQPSKSSRSSAITRGSSQGVALLEEIARAAQRKRAPQAQRRLSVSTTRRVQPR